jgi:hypothetical protein
MVRKMECCIYQMKFGCLRLTAPERNERATESPFPLI